MRWTLILLLAVLTTPSAQAQPMRVASPDGRVEVAVDLMEEGVLSYAVYLNDELLLASSPLGLVTTMARWDRNLKVVDAGEVERIEDAYRLAHGKQRDVRYEAHRRVVRLADEAGRELEVVFQVSDAGVALRYQIPQQAGIDTVTAERELPASGFPSRRGAGSCRWTIRGRAG